MTEAHPEAADVFRDGLTLAPGDAHLESYLAWVSGLLGHEDTAQGILDDLQRRREHGYISAFQIAMAYLGLGRSTEATDWLGQAYSDGDPLLSYLGVWWICDPLRSDPRFQDILRRMKAPQTGV